MTMTELKRSKGGKDSKKVKRSHRSTRSGFVPRKHNKISPLRRYLHRKEQLEEYSKEYPFSPLMAPFDNYLCRLFALMRASGLPAPKG